MIIGSVKEIAEEYASDFDLKELKEAARILYKVADRSFKGLGAYEQVIKVKEFMKFTIELGEKSEIMRAIEYKLLKNSTQYGIATQRIAEVLVEEYEKRFTDFLNTNINLKGDFFVDCEHNATTQELTYSICYKDVIVKNVIFMSQKK
ncbi:hypothetical protein C1N61_28710 (plasmid) [Priestia aryabhattai]